MGKYVRVDFFTYQFKLGLDDSGLFFSVVLLHVIKHFVLISEDYFGFIRSIGHLVFLSCSFFEYKFHILKFFQ